MRIKDRERGGGWGVGGWYKALAQKKRKQRQGRKPNNLSCLREVVYVP